MGVESYVLLFNSVANLINMQTILYDHIILFMSILTVILIGYITFTAWILNKKINQQKVNNWSKYYFLNLSKYISIMVVETFIYEQLGFLEVSFFIIMLTFMASIIFIMWLYNKKENKNIKKAD